MKEKINIVQLSVDIRGGAGRVMQRLHDRFRQHGHHSQMVVRLTGIDDPDPYTHLLTELSPSPIDKLSMAVSRVVELSLGMQPWAYPASRRWLQSEMVSQADMLLIHNVHGGFFNYRLLPHLTRSKPVVWILHDMWAFTGHCAYAYECNRWITGCFDCPLLKKDRVEWVEPRPTWRDVTKHEWQAKRDSYQKARMLIVAPSKWLQQEAQQSILGINRSIHHIPYGLDLSIYYPINKQIARQQLGIPSDAHVLFFSAQNTANKRKGLEKLWEALERLPVEIPIYLLTIGSKGSIPAFSRPFEINELGYIVDEETIRLCYGAADMFVFPSLADNLPLVLMESLACGTPMVAFDVGGVSDMVRHNETGYLARYRDSADLAHGITTLLENPDLRQTMSQNCRAIAEKEYGIDLQVQRYLDLYQTVIDRQRSEQ